MKAILENSDIERANSDRRGTPVYAFLQRLKDAEKRGFAPKGPFNENDLDEWEARNTKPLSEAQRIRAAIREIELKDKKRAELDEYFKNLFLQIPKK